MSSTFLPISGSPRKKPEPMTVSTSDLDASLARVQIKLFVDFKMLRSYSNAMGEGNVLRVDFSDNQGRISAVAFADTAARLNAVIAIGKTYNVKLPTIKKVQNKNGQDTHGLELLLTSITIVTEDASAPLERTLKFFRDLENCAGIVAIQVCVASIREEPFYYACQNCKKKNAEDASSCGSCGKNPLSWRLLLNMTVTDTAGQHRHVVLFEEQARLVIGKLPQGADVFEAVEKRCPELIGSSFVFLCRNKLGSQDQNSVQVLDVEVPLASLDVVSAPAPSSVDSAASLSPVSSTTTTSSQSLSGFEIASSFTPKRIKLEADPVKLEQLFEHFPRKPSEVNVMEEVTFLRKSAPIRNKK